MHPLSIGDLAPDFSLPDDQGNIFKLSAVIRLQNVLLVFNLGFI
jgi:peroxiredoxin